MQSIFVISFYLVKHRGTIINEFISNFPVVLEQLNDKYDICLYNVVELTEFFNLITGLEPRL